METKFQRAQAAAIFISTLLVPAAQAESPGAPRVEAKVCRGALAPSIRLNNPPFNFLNAIAGPSGDEARIPAKYFHFIREETR